MSPLKIYIKILLLCVLCSVRAFSQAPKDCTTPPVGVAGGSFALSQDLICIDANTKTGSITVNNAQTGKAGVTVGNVSYVFDYKDGILGNPSTVLSQITTKQFGPADAGKDIYILQYLNGSDGKAYVTCRSVHIYSTDMPNVQVSSCGTTAKLTFPVDAANRYDFYKIVWENGAALDKVPVTGGYPFTIPHTYTGSQSRIMTVVGGYNHPFPPVGFPDLEAGCNSTPFIKTFSPSSNLYISRLEMTDNGMGAKMEFKNFLAGKTYKFKADKNNAGTFGIDVGTGKDGALVIPATLDSAATYCFRIDDQDECGNPLKSEAICSITEKPQVISKSEVKLDWNHPGGKTVEYDVQRTESGGIFIVQNPSPKTKNTFNDTKDILCNKIYTYQIVGTYTLGTFGTVTTVSAKKSVSTNIPSTLPAKDPIGTASVEQANTTIKIIIRDSKTEPKYRFYRSVDSENNFSLVKETDGNNGGANQFEDKNVDPIRHRYCYRVTYSDECGNWSAPTSPLCSILLTSDGPGSLKWTDFIEDPTYKTYVTYDVSEVDSLTGLMKGNPLVSHTPDTRAIVNLLDAGDSKSFIIRAIYMPPGLPAGTAFSSLSNTVTFTIPARIFIPTAFTPNGDGSNENFTAKGVHIQIFNMVIYDRWGKPIFETNKLEDGWDGNMDDRTTVAPAGTYNYVATVTDTHGQKFTRTGSVMLIR
jgi:gliding motility-associated-like protein